jgi:hypothetical protein
LPWTLRRDEHFFDAHVLDALPKGCAVDGVPVAREIARRFIPGKGVNNLLRCPLRRWMLGNIKVEYAPPFMRQEHQYEEDAECHRGDDKEIYGN